MASHGGTTTDHDEIRRWAEARGAKPARVVNTGSEDPDEDPGIIRLDFPGYSGAGSLEEITWDEWFQAFDDGQLALVYQDTTADGERSNFNKLVGRDTVERREEGESHANRHDGGESSTSARGPTETKRATKRSASKRASKRASKTTARSGAKTAGTRARKSAPSKRVVTPTKKSTAKSATTKKSATKNAAAKKSGAKKAPAKKVTAKKVTAKKTTASSTRSSARTSTAKRGTAKKAPSRTPGRSGTSKRGTAKKATRRR